ncbi:CocE/NonD family hydrolase [Kineosporia babensis]|uniref:CocE/NonD family hydrolase n=1 Tax=Kineosporia babensis TaxID=499548 RepID=A0A9X1NMI6_9ACTN|nr:CocE/NonD family hydrolase [Kineosporia babensis]
MKSNRKAVFALSPVVAACFVTATVPAGAASAASVKDPVTHAQNQRVPKGAAWTERYFPSTGGVELHADVLLPEKLKPGQKVPVVLAVGPYFGHSGQMGVEGFKKTGPSARFNDLINEGKLLERGYALVMVDSRGFGGSTGCHDLFGPGEQADVKAAVDWAAKQSWSSGAVAMYGKSYDASTALIGSNLDHEALKAVVAMEPLWEPYRNFRSDGVPRATISSVANQYSTIANSPQMPDDTERYRENAAWETRNPECSLTQLGQYQIAGHDSQFWKDRDLAEKAAGTNTPLFVTQGFTEWNTEAEGMQQFLDNHEGPERGWLGPWDHVRGNDRFENGDLKMGRGGWFKELFAFYDEHLKGVEPATEYPAFAVQDSNGQWRGMKAWPTADAASSVALGSGSYLDDGMESADAAKATFVRHSQPVQRDTRITGTPRVSLEAGRDANVHVKLYDVAPDGQAVMFDEQVSQLREGKAAFEMRSTDWVLKKGHQLAVQIGTVQPGIPTSADWLASPTGQNVDVSAAALELQLDDPSDDVATKGKPAPYLKQYRAAYTTELPGKPSFTFW